MSQKNEPSKTDFINACAAALACFFAYKAWEVAAQQLGETVRQTTENVSQTREMVTQNRIAWTSLSDSRESRIQEQQQEAINLIAAANEAAEDRRAQARPLVSFTNMRERADVRIVRQNGRPPRVDSVNLRGLTNFGLGSAVDIEVRWFTKSVSYSDNRPVCTSCFVSCRPVRPIPGSLLPEEKADSLEVPCFLSSDDAMSIDVVEGEVEISYRDIWGLPMPLARQAFRARTFYDDPQPVVAFEFGEPFEPGSESSKVPTSYAPMNGDVPRWPPQEDLRPVPFVPEGQPAQEAPAPPAIDDDFREPYEPQG